MKPPVGYGEERPDWKLARGYAVYAVGLWKVGDSERVVVEIRPTDGDVLLAVLDDDDIAAIAALAGVLARNRGDA